MFTTAGSRAQRKRPKLFLPPGYSDCRLTYSSANAVPTSDQLAQGTVYLCPVSAGLTTDHGWISTPDGGVWTPHYTAQISVAFANIVNTKTYDLFLFNNGGTLVIVADVAWTSNSVRNHNLSSYQGWVANASAFTDVITGTIAVPVNSARWLGCFYANGTNLGEDSLANRLLYNAQNRVIRPLFYQDTTANWSYASTTWRQARGVTTNQVAVVIGATGTALDLCLETVSEGSNNSTSPQTGIGEDSTTVPTDAKFPVAWTYVGQGVGTHRARHVVAATTYPALGYHYYAWMERMDNNVTGTFYGTDGTYKVNGFTGKVVM